MGFLDSLEGDLKNLESAAERDPAEAARRQAARDAERAAARASASHAEQLRTSKFTADLLNQVVLLGRSRRLMVRVTWIGSSLRLEAREHRLELRPTANNVEAHFLSGSAETERLAVDFSSNPEDLAKRWLDSFGAV
jgi:hypothetical protein